METMENQTQTKENGFNTSPPLSLNYVSNTKPLADLNLLESSQTATLTIQGTEQKAQAEQIQTISIKPSIEESERFIQYLNKRFNLGIANDLIINIHETKGNIRGFFMPKRNPKAWNLAEPTSQAEQSDATSKATSDNATIQNLLFKQQQQEKNKIHSITLSSHELINEPYETLAHELAHYLNANRGIQDTTSNQYHNKHFKAQAERLLLSVDRDKRRGYAYTKMTEQFKEMLNDFKTSQTAFKIFQSQAEPMSKGKSRLLLYQCSCNCKIRTARNEGKPLKAICQYCNTEFKAQEPSEDF